MYWCGKHWNSNWISDLVKFSPSVRLQVISPMSNACSSPLPCLTSHWRGPFSNSVSPHSVDRLYTSGCCIRKRSNGANDWTTKNSWICWAPPTWNPGPNSTETCIHFGYLRTSAAGMLVAGLGFTLQAMGFVLAFATLVRPIRDSAAGLPNLVLSLPKETRRACPSYLDIQWPHTPDPDAPARISTTNPETADRMNGLCRFYAKYLNGPGAQTLPNRRRLASGTVTSF